MPWYWGTARHTPLTCAPSYEEAMALPYCFSSPATTSETSDELRLVEPREVHAHLDEVVAGLRLDLGRVLGLLRAHVGDVVDLELDAGVLGEALPDLGQLLVGGGGEVVPAEVRDLALLAPRGRHAGGEDAGEAGPVVGQELAASDGSHGLLLTEGTGRDKNPGKVCADCMLRGGRLSRVPGGRARPRSVAAGVTGEQRDDLAGRVEAERARLADHVEVGALRDLRQEGLGALDLAEHQRVPDADHPGALGRGEADAVQRGLHRLAVGLEGERAAWPRWGRRR